jgi:hypothetical protein
MSATASTSNAWLDSFVPRLVLALGAGLDADGSAVLDTDGVVLVADIVSFTPRAVERAARGRPGQAELSAELDHCVSLVAESTHDCGGELVGFAGDSLICLFGGATGPGAWEQAQRCAELIQAGAGAPGLPMRVGLAGGAVRLVVIRSGPRSHSVLLGDPVIGAARAQATARPGGVATDGELGPATELAPSAILGQTAPHPPSLELIESFVPAPVVARSRAGQSEWLAEIRPVTSLFASLRRNGEPVDEPPDLARAVRSTDAVLRAHGASIGQIVRDEKGTVIWAPFGATTGQPGDRRAERAVRAGVALADELAEAELEAHIGIATGQSVVGAFGDPRGRVFAVVGPHMNLAARLMQASGGRLLVDEETMTRCRHVVGSEPVTLELKGIGSLIVHAVSGAASGSAGLDRSEPSGGDQSPLVGRDHELRTILSALEAFDQEGGSAGAVAVTGQAGIGKTSLLDAVVAQATARGIRTAQVVGDPIAVSFPFKALTELLGDAPQELTAAQRSAGPALTGQEAGAALDGVAAALNDRLGDGRILLTVRDAHWVDDGSLAALERLAGLTDRIFLLLECRSEAAAPGQPVGDLLVRGRATRLELEGLGAEDVGTLAKRWLGVTGISSELVDVLAQRAGGNPFFVQQLAATLPQLGYVARYGEVAQLLAKPSVESTEDVPSTIHDALSSRIDGLAPDASVALKAASVLGLTFEADAVQAVHPLRVGADELARALDDLVAADLIQPLPAPDGAFRFRHALYREVTYSLLTQPQRTAAHTAAAEWIEQQPDGQEKLVLLAHHWTQADVSERAVPLLSTAARRAAEVWAGLSTIELITTAKRLADRDRLVIDSRQRGEWDLLLGQAYRGAGEMAKGDRLIADGLALVGMALPSSHPARLAAVGLEVGDQVRTRTTGGRRIGRLAAEQEHLTVVLNAYRALAVAAYNDDDLLQMALVNLRILNLVEAAGLRSELPLHYSMAQLASASAGARWPALYYRRLARRAAAAHRDALSTTHGLSYDGVFLMGNGNLRTAREQFHAVERRYADVIPGSYVVDLVVSLQGYVDYFTARFSESIDIYRRVHAAGLERGDPGMVAWGLNGEAMVRLARGEDQAVLGCLARSGELPMERLAQIAWHSFHALASVRIGALDDARAQADSATKLLLAERATVAVLQPEYSALAEVTLHLQQIGSDAERRRASGMHRQVLLGFGRLQRRFRVARPMYLVRRGDQHRFAGDTRRANRCYEAAGRLSRRLGMPFEAALARLGSGSIAGDVRDGCATLRELGVESVSVLTGPGSLEYRSLNVEKRNS